MSYTKRQLITEAFGELALQGFEFDITPEEQQSAARRMETMVALWVAKDIRIGYRFAADPGGIDLDADSGVALRDIEAVVLNTAVRMAPSYGKQISPITAAAARQGYEALLMRAVPMLEQQQPSTMPRGAGNRYWQSEGWVFMPVPDTSPLQIAEDGGLKLGS